MTTRETEYPMKKNRQMNRQAQRQKSRTGGRQVEGDTDGHTDGQTGREKTFQKIVLRHGLVQAFRLSVSTGFC